jgi:acetyltransferase-like isoleucine patch superfamily enzyme
MNDRTSMSAVCEDQINLNKTGKAIAAGVKPRRELRNRAVAILEYTAVRITGRILGPSVIVRYLRNPNPLVSVRLLRAFGAVVGNQTTVKGSIFFDNVERDENSTGDFSHLKIGDNCYVGDGVFFDLANEVVIENDAVIAGRVSFVTHAECRRSAYLSRKFPRRCEPIIVGSGAWVGFGATVLAGVIVGSNSTLGAHSLVLKSTEPQCVYFGSPARKVSQFEDRP